MPEEIPEPLDPPPRYTPRPLPPYRYVPGLQPHPVAHPQGHSYDPSGAHPASGALPAPEEWPESADYLYGVDLYNRWYWWEAHEAWEGLWQQSDKQGVQGHFLQFLIQVSACHLQRHVGHTEGLRRLRARAERHLTAVAARVEPGNAYMGLDVHAFAAQVVRFLDGASERFPFIDLAVRER